MRASQLMRTPAVSCGPHRTIRDVADAAALMVKRSIRRIPVVDERGHAHGLMSFDDIIRHVGRQADELGDVVASQARGHTTGA